MMNGHRASVSASVSRINAWLKSPFDARLTDVVVSSEKRNDRFSSARGQSTDQPAPSPLLALRNMIRQNIQAPSYGGFGGMPPNPRPPRRPNCAAATVASDAMPTA